jgi:hypothetical protein
MFAAAENAGDLGFERLPVLEDQFAHSPLLSGFILHRGLIGMIHS